MNTAIILAAGQGKRMKRSMNKTRIEVKGKPIIVHTIEAFIHSDVIQTIILVVSETEVELFENEIIKKYFPNYLNIKIVVGGKERYNSVFNGLKHIEQGTVNVLIHDGARPLVTKSEIVTSVNTLSHEKACVVAVKAKNTYKLADKNGYVEKTIPRQDLFSILTPQSFRKEIIMNAYLKGIDGANGITDDAMMVELFTSEKVKIVEGSYENIKVTTPEDLAVMERILDERKNNSENA